VVLVFLFKFIGAMDCGLGFDTADSEPVTPDNTVIIVLYSGLCTMSVYLKLQKKREKERESRDFSRLTGECVPKFSKPQTRRSARESVTKILIWLFICSKLRYSRLSTLGISR
jgi:hypothetical protein